MVAFLPVLNFLVNLPVLQGESKDCFVYMTQLVRVDLILNGLLCCIQQKKKMIYHLFSDVTHLHYLTTRVMILTTIQGFNK